MDGVANKNSAAIFFILHANEVDEHGKPLKFSLALSSKQRAFLQMSYSWLIFLFKLSHKSICLENILNLLKVKYFS